MVFGIDDKIAALLALVDVATLKKELARRDQPVRRVPELLEPAKVLAQPIEGLHPKLFIGGEPWLTNNVEIIRKTLTLVDEGSSKSSSRKPVFAVVRMTRGGKTRALQELTNALRSANIVAVFISFNGSTPFRQAERANLQEAFDRRVMYALRRDRDLMWQDCGSEPGCVQKWFDDCQDAVLLIDEINIPLDPTSSDQAQQDLWTMLKTTFLVKNRSLVFSSHVNESYSQATSDFMSTPSVRPVITIAPPLIDDPAGVVAALRSTRRITVETIAVFGRVPGQVLDSEGAVTRILDARATAPLDMQDFARACLKSDASVAERLPLVLRQLAFFDVRDGQKHFTWTPYAIAVLQHRDEDLGKLFRSVFAFKERSGDVWELIVLLAVLLHLESREPHPYMPKLSEGEIRVVHLDPAHKTVCALLEWVNDTKPSGAVLLVYPLAADFQDYDILVMSKRTNKWRVAGGWQCKTTRGYPERPAPVPGSSWMMNGAAPQTSKKRNDGWTMATAPLTLSFLGSSLATAVPNLWRTDVSRVTGRKRRPTQSDEM